MFKSSLEESGVIQDILESRGAETWDDQTSEFMGAKDFIMECLESAYLSGVEDGKIQAYEEIATAINGELEQKTSTKFVLGWVPRYERP
jgi:hypothetical protein